MSPEAVQLILAVFGMSGLLGAIVAVVKLRPEGNERAVAASGNAVQSIDVVLEEVKEQRDYWKRIAGECHEDLEACRVRCREREEQVDQWRERALRAEQQLEQKRGSP